MELSLTLFKSHLKNAVCLTILDETEGDYLIMEDIYLWHFL